MPDAESNGHYRLPAGVVVTGCSTVADERGLVAELYRQSDLRGEPPAQWNVMASTKNALRGMHVHVRHTDWIVVVAGVAQLGLVDLRGSDTERRPQTTITLSTNPMCVVTVPPGVLHGIYTPESAVLLNALSHEYDPADDFAVHVDDPQIDLDWGLNDPILSERDRVAPSIDTLLADLARRGIRFPVIDP